MACHKEHTTSVIHDQHFLCEKCRDHWIDVKDRDNERRGWPRRNWKLRAPFAAEALWSKEWAEWKRENRPVLRI